MTGSFIFRELKNKNPISASETRFAWLVGWASPPLSFVPYTWNSACLCIYQAMVRPAFTTLQNTLSQQIPTLLQSQIHAAEKPKLSKQRRIQKHLKSSGKNVPTREIIYSGCPRTIREWLRCRKARKSGLGGLKEADCPNASCDIGDCQECKYEVNFN